MTSKFLERNKKKSLLGLLLLFLRERKALVLLLLVLLLGTSLFLPSSLLLHVPGGSRFAAGIAWIAGKAGVDVSRWGLARSGPLSFGDLLAAFRAAKQSGSGTPGWGPFFSGRGRGGAGAAGAQSSLDFVAGHRSDLDAGPAKGAGAGAGGSSSIRGVVDPAEARADRDANAVPLSEADLGGQREGWVKSAFAGGFMNGLLGGSGAGGDGALRDGAGALSGGAYAGKGFFSGSGGAASGSSTDRARAGLDGLAQAQIPKGRIGGAAKGRLSAMRASAVDARAARGAARAGALGGNRAFVQLAEGRGRAALSVTPNCTPPDCPGEFATTNTGAIYDGNRVDGSGTDVLTAPQIDGVQSPNIPDSGIAQQYENQAQQMDADAKKCQQLDSEYGPQETALNQQMENISGRFRSASCGSGGCSRSKADYCQGLGNQLRSTCSQYEQVRCAHTKACPLTADQDCSHECMQVGDGIHHQSVTINPDQRNNQDAHGHKTR